MAALAPYATRDSRQSQKRELARRQRGAEKAAKIDTSEENGCRARYARQISSRLCQPRLTIDGYLPCYPADGAAAFILRVMRITKRLFNAC